MATDSRTRISVCSETTTLDGQTVIVVPPNARIGAFSKAITPVADTPEQAMQEMLDLPESVSHSRHDRLIKRSNGGWQCWALRDNARGVNHPDDYEYIPHADRRARKHRGGTGRVYWQR